MGVQGGGGFVEKEHARLVDQGHGQSQALFLAAGKLGIEGVALFLEAEALEQRGGIAPALVKTGKHGYRFANAKLVGQRGGLQDGADLLLKVIAGGLGIEAADANDPAVGRAKSFEDFDGAGFSGAVGAEKAKNLALLDFEADAAQRLDVAVAFGKVVDLDDGSAHSVNGYL